MKKSLLSAICLTVASVSFGQTSVFQENFDAMTLGSGVVQQSSSWSFWSASTNTDAIISTDFAFSPANSVFINGQTTDLVLPIGPYNSGKYDVKFKMYIPNGSTGGYFNALHAWTNSTTSYEWAADVFFDGAGSMTWTLGGTPGGAVIFPLDTWFDIQVTADLDADLGKLYLNGTSVAEWQWSLNNADGTAGTNAIAGFDFFGTDANNGEGSYYIDDVQVVESTGVGLTSLVSNEIKVYPNPANATILVQLPENMDLGTIAVFDILGNQVSSTSRFIGSKTTIDISGLNNGVYFIKAENKNVRLCSQVVKI